MDISIKKTVNKYKKGSIYSDDHYMGNKLTQKITQSSSIKMTKGRLRVLQYVKDNPNLLASQIHLAVDTPVQDVYALKTKGYLRSIPHSMGAVFKITPTGNKALKDADPIDMSGVTSPNILDSVPGMNLVWKLAKKIELSPNDLLVLSQLLKQGIFEVKVSEDMLDAIENIRFAKKIAKLDITL